MQCCTGSGSLKRSEFLIPYCTVGATICLSVEGHRILLAGYWRRKKHSDVHFFLTGFIHIVSSRRSVSRGAAQKTAKEKWRGKRGEKAFSRRVSPLFFHSPFLRWLTDRLEEAIWMKPVRKKCRCWKNAHQTKRLIAPGYLLHRMYVHWLIASDFTEKHVFCFFFSQVGSEHGNVIGVTSRFALLQKFSLNFSSSSFVIRVNLLHP